MVDGDVGHQGRLRSGGELVEAGAEEEAELVSGMECEEASVGLGWKFGKRSLTSSEKDAPCLIRGPGPAQWNQASTSSTAHASLGGLGNELNFIKFQSPGKFGVGEKRAK